MSKSKLFKFLRIQGVDHLLKPPPTTATKVDDRNTPLHLPVLFEKVHKTISIHPKILESPLTMIDCTLGLGGHSIGSLKHFKNLHILGLDCDERMINYVQNLDVFPQVEDRLCLDVSNFANVNFYESGNIFPNVCSGRSRFDFILADLGINSLHLDKNEWGISYIKDGKLDMRYDNVNNKKTAADLLNTCTVLELTDIFSKYGDEPLAQSIAIRIEKRRKEKLFETSDDLKNVILEDEHNNHKFRSIVRCFQALRITVNDEMENLRKLLEKIPLILAKDGMAMFITFHSLEHKMVSNSMKEMAKNKLIKIVSKGEDPSEDEIKSNPKSKSAKFFSYKMLKIQKEAY